MIRFRKIATKALRALALTPLVIAGVATGKVIQYGMVENYGDELGFNGASLIALIMIVILLYSIRYGWRLFAVRRGQGRSQG